MMMNNRIRRDPDLAKAPKSGQIFQIWKFAKSGTPQFQWVTARLGNAQILGAKSANLDFTPKNKRLTAIPDFRAKPPLSGERGAHAQALRTLSNLRGARPMSPTLPTTRRTR
jgi:hypothetical protein